MADADLVEGFFDELGRRGHDPLLDKLDGTGRFEIIDGGRTDQWLVTVKAGCPTVAQGGGEADWVMRADRDEFNRVIHGDTGALAAVIRGAVTDSLDKPARFNLLTRLFAGSPESRKQTHDECWHGRRGE
jgi:SCP-2 sterol transfer family